MGARRRHDGRLHDRFRPGQHGDSFCESERLSGASIARGSRVSALIVNHRMSGGRLCTPVFSFFAFLEIVLMVLVHLFSATTIVMHRGCNGVKLIITSHPLTSSRLFMY